jgi:hypothetical protein
MPVGALLGEGEQRKIRRFEAGRVKVPRGARYTNSPAIVEARLRPVSARAGVSDAQYTAALKHVAATGTVPAGWELQGVRWGHFTVRGEETDSFRFTSWQAGQAIDLQGFPPDLFRHAVVGIERLEGEERTVVRERRETVTVKEWTGRARSVRTGHYVKAAYAKRYPHLVDREYVRRRRVVVRKVKERVPVEEAVIRFTYEANFTVSDTPELGE